MTSRTGNVKAYKYAETHKPTRKRLKTEESKVGETIKVQSSITSHPATLIRKKIKKVSVAESDVNVEKMASKQFEGWKINLGSTSCGFIKFNPREDEVFKKHVTVDINISKSYQGRSIGPFALKQAIEKSSNSCFVAFLKKSNIPSKKVLTAVSFKEFAYPGSRQLCMFLRKIK